MAVTPHIYGMFAESLVEGLVNVLTDPLWCMLVTSGYVFNKNVHKFKSSITGELVGSGYSIGGQPVGLGSAPYYNSSIGILQIPASNVVWPTVTWVGAVGAVLYMNPAGFPDSAKPLVSYIDFGGPVDRTAEAFYLNWPTTGILKMTVP